MKDVLILIIKCFKAICTRVIWSTKKFYLNNKFVLYFFNYNRNSGFPFLRRDLQEMTSSSAYTLKDLRAIIYQSGTQQC